MVCSQVPLAFILALILKYTDGNPVFSPDFDDPWDFKVAPHEDPVIKSIAAHSDLPSVSKREGKESRISDKDFDFVEANFKISEAKKKLGKIVREPFSCAVCSLGAGLIFTDVRKGIPAQSIKEKFVSLCTAFRLQTLDVCTGIFDVFSVDILPVVNATDFGPGEICKQALGEACEGDENPLYKWTIDLPDIPKPKVEEKDVPDFGKPYLKVLQISDTHIDPDYVEGSPANCKEPLCCRKDSTPEDKKSVIPAGRWGAYPKCDSPLIFVENMLEHIALSHPDIDYIIWTGDLPAHDIWNQSKNAVLESLEQHVELMKEYFPGKPIFPALGNHEGVPVGSFPPPWVFHDNYSMSWLYRELETQWRSWLPEQSDVTVQQGGFYSVLIRPGFRLISLNMNYCNFMSWWLLLNNTDPAKELKWLVYELQMAEDKGEKVHIIGHIPPGEPDCLKEWSKNYNRIIDRYESTITGQFFGHTHGDEFEVFYDEETSKRPTNVAFIAPSVTTFIKFNPAYRIYYVDGDHEQSTWEVIDHETWTTDLEEANKEGNIPHWYKLYTARSAYDMKSLRPQEWDNLIKRMLNDPKLFSQFYKYHYRNSKARPFCDLNCEMRILCDLKSGKSQSRKHLCGDIRSRLEEKYSNVED